MSQPQHGSDFSVAQLLSPVPTHVAGKVFRVLADVPATLAAPIIRVVVAAACTLQLAEGVAKNVVWKVSHYLPALCQHASSVGDLPRSLKDFFSLSSGATLAQIPNLRAVCACGHPLSCRPRMEKANIPCNLPGIGGTREHRFKVYSLAAGVQFASFEEKYCNKCRWFYLNCWRNKKGTKPVWASL